MWQKAGFFSLTYVLLTLMQIGGALCEVCQVGSAAERQVLAPEGLDGREFLHSLEVPGWVMCHQTQMVWIAFYF